MATAGPATAVSGGGDVATQTEPPKVDAGIQAELSDLTTASEPVVAARPQTVAGSRPATVLRLPATKDGAGVPQPRPPTQSQGKPATAASVAAPLWPRRSTQSTQPQTPAESAVAGFHAGDGGSSGGQPGVLFVDNRRSWQQFQESSGGQRQHGAECTPMVYSYNPDPRLRAWQSLEHARLHQMGLSSKLSRRYNVQRSRQFVPVGLHMRAMQPGQAEFRAAFLPPLVEEFAQQSRKKNDVAPFLTFQKPTCGFYFSRETDNRKIRHGLAPADLPSWGADLSDRQ